MSAVTFSSFVSGPEYAHARRLCETWTHAAAQYELITGRRASLTAVRAARDANPRQFSGSPPARSSKSHAFRLVLTPRQRQIAADELLRRYPTGLPHSLPRKKLSRELSAALGFPLVGCGLQDAITRFEAMRAGTAAGTRKVQTSLPLSDTPAATEAEPVPPPQAAAADAPQAATPSSCGDAAVAAADDRHYLISAVIQATASPAEIKRSGEFLTVSSERDHIVLIPKVLIDDAHIDTALKFLRAAVAAVREL